MTSPAVAPGRALRPRARILRTLGEELISSETVAILELVKNAYDADAGYVLVRFEGPTREGEGVLTIEDNGHGMALTTVESSWMEPATNNKKVAKKSQYLERRLLGEKGVGRFASARLARELELSTRTPQSSVETYVYFDWSQFDNEDLYLDQVLILAEERSPLDFVEGRSVPDSCPSGKAELPRDGSHGTILRMSKLKRDWSEKEMAELRRGLSRLISPFDDHGDFKIFLQSASQTAESATELAPPEVVKYPHYKVSGEISAEGKYLFRADVLASGESQEYEGWLSRSDNLTRLSMVGDRSEIRHSIKCGAISFQILIWDRDQLDNIQQKIGTGITNIRKDLDAISGISIYRDGFRVLPYGEPENDWLKLDIRRVQNPTMRLSNNQLTGFVKISADSNPLLKDQSNREGLDSNAAYSDLQDILILALTEIEKLRSADKKTKRIHGKDVSDDALFGEVDTSALKARLNQIGSDEEALALLDDFTNQWESKILRVKQVLTRYHSLATLGQLVDKVIHDGRQPLSTIQGQASLALEATLRAAKAGDVRPECSELLRSLTERLKKVKDAAGLIDLVLKRIEPLGGRRKGRPSKVYLNEIIKSALSHFEADIKSLGILVSTPDTDDLVQVDALELQEVLINLISNSIYWLQRKPQHQRRILIEYRRPSTGTLEITFADSGPGISKSDRPMIFEPYFSSKPDGVGLGLVIAGEIIKEFYDGSLELLDSGPLPGAIFLITLRKRV
ncbi:ATP-binding protein [Xanthomonas sp. A2111]|uniref:histidine kinase n=1 Tax=Xanthomonas hawaiiensis TaxID=3003247 RepID=A0ABU2I4M1_9XANT|nr:ATP-binding protein [Xanthomonas sp. A2111]MBO9830589.1 ATP-binding protein [Xanthomonas sp. A2111]MDS9992795.1 ATP-binding protein [Xanthomonas sp. A2111]